MNRPLLFAVFAAVVLLIGGAVAWWLWAGGGGNVVPPPGGGGVAPVAAGLPPGRAAELVAAKNLALGRLEANEPAAADPLLVELADAVPGDPLGVRNLAVGRVLAVDEYSGAAVPVAERADWRPRAEAAVQKFAAAEPDAVAPHYLAARLAAAGGDETAHAAALRRVIAADPEAAWPRFAFHEAFSVSRDDALVAEAERQLFEAYRREPGNVWILLNLAPQAAAAGSPEAVDVLERLREKLEPFAGGFAYRQRGGVPALLGEAIAAAEAGTWPLAAARANAVRNVTKSESVARSDRLALERHPLDFVAADFDPAFYESTGLPRVPVGEPPPVEFVPFAGPPALPADLAAGPVRDAAVVNFDLVGPSEILLLTDDAVRVLTRDDGETWTESLSHPVDAGFTHLTAVDLDTDADEAPRDDRGRPAVVCHTADPDLILWGPAGVRLLENRLSGDRTTRSLEPMPQAEAFDAMTAVTALAAADVDQEGDVDLLAFGADGPRVWINRGNRTFEERTDRSDFSGLTGTVTDTLPIDLDRDVDLDVVLGVRGGSSGYLENLRHGELRWVPFPKGPLAGAVAVAPLDIDGNASWDLATGGLGGLAVTTSRTPAPGRLDWRNAVSLLPAPVVAVRALDVNNDGRTDLLVRRDPVNSDAFGGLFNSDADWTLWLGGANVEYGLPDLSGEVSADADDLVPHDFDRDGDLDLLAAGESGVTLLENRGGEANNSLTVRLLAQFDKDGTDPKRSNHWGLGSLLELKTGPLYQPAVVTGEETHFGLGDRDAADVLRVLWPNGIPEVILQPAVGPDGTADVCHPQKLGGSCPYLYVWDGEGFRFSTDLCWAAPIGLQWAEGKFVPTRNWEYVKLEGARPVPRDTPGGRRYVLQITDELWEADYFDRVELRCVDHPPGTAVFTNEKVGPPDAVDPKLHTARTLRPPVRVLVRNASGGERDATDAVRSLDGDFLKPYGRTITQGYAEDWEIELDLGDVPDPAGVTLLLTGWVWPTDTGINVMLDQNPDLFGPRPPAVWLEDGDGGWERVIEHAGFPGGKTKTIAVELPPLRGGSTRVRLAGSQELRWDRIAFTSGDEPVDVRVTPAPLVAADLEYRGFSARSWPASGHGPDRYDHADVTPHPVWPPLGGTFTRYGDVRDLLTAADDRQVVMSPGDAATLHFAVPPEPGAPGGAPAGWIRDFVLHSVGYDKDANLHTVDGQTSDPLPFAAMTQYPPLGVFPDTPELRAWQRDYQTRRPHAAAFRGLVRDWD